MTLARMRTRSATSDCALTPVDKWKVFEAVKTCKTMLDLGTGTLLVLQALLNFKRDRYLSAGESLIVYPSNRTLSQRAHDMPESTLRRHLGKLVKAGIILRRDSANGKRYARGNGPLRIEFGFDLSPMIFRASEFFSMASDLNSLARDWKVLHEQVKACRRELSDLLDDIEQFCPAEALNAFRARLASMPTRATRATTTEDLREQLERLLSLERDALAACPDADSSERLSADDSQNERHIQDSKSSKYPIVLEEIALDPDEPGGALIPRPLNLPFQGVLDACPEFAAYSNGPISNLSQFIQTASIVRNALAIQSDAWEDAVRALGLENASYVIAAILQRHTSNRIRVPGAYLRALTKMASQGKFSPRPMLVSLMRERLKSRHARSLPPNRHVREHPPQKGRRGDARALQTWCATHLIDRYQGTCT
jgi:replication initiation protein RepC